MVRRENEYMCVYGVRATKNRVSSAHSVEECGARRTGESFTNEQ